MKQILFLLIALTLFGCGQHSFFDEVVTELQSRTGWLATQENFHTIPQDISSFSGDISSMPRSVSFEDRFPPIGDQGQYGTCVAWAVGYSMKTALNGIERSWTSSQLSNAANQTSPKDLWMAIPASSKGANCNGTNFEAAFDALISKGASSLSQVPYTNMGNCSGTSSGNANNKLANYRKIAFNDRLTGGTRSDGMSVDNFKGYISQGRPVAIGARLGDRFMRWNSSATISSDTYNDPGMQHAYHAMVLVGYDDSKSAFRVINSWGPSWGDRGNIWVDYDFFLNNFCFAAFVAQNPNTAPNDRQLSSGYDLLASFAEDFPDPRGTNQSHRAFSYDVFNNGSLPILASQKWTVFYMYYNAYNANEFGIISEDYYTNENGKLGDYGDFANSQAIAGGVWNHFNVAPGKKASEEEFPDGFAIRYTMPNITGDYYLVVYADAYDVIQESNEDNNFYFITAANGRPLKFSNGVMQSTPARTAATSNFDNALGRKVERVAPAASVVELGELNGYTPQEIKLLLNKNKQDGTLGRKIAEYRASGAATVKVPRTK
ncbi:MAG: hypothetical protein LBU89_08875 [Fibromonadaceae bacterium]|jgi:hypothetical protein|nr:hypothetical protein [Fibromonadaceae bacterium]